MEPGKQLHINRAKMGKQSFSPAVQQKGEEFVQTMLAEELDYENMKSAFLFCLVRTLMVRSKGVIVEAAKLAKTHRNQLSNLVNVYGLKDAGKPK